MTAIDKKEQILKVVCEVVGITKYMLTDQSRKKKVVFARHIAAHHINEIGVYTLLGIAQILGRTHHATVCNNLQKYTDLTDSNQEFASYAEAINNKLNNAA